MYPKTTDYKRLILTDMLVAFNGSRSPVDARFARAHENITGVELFQRDHSLISFIPAADVDATKVVSEISSIIAVNIDGNYFTNADSASQNDICHFVVDCSDYNTSVNFLNRFINREVNYCGVFQLTNINQLNYDLLGILTTAISDRTFNGKQLSSCFFIATLSADHNQAELTYQADKLINLGFVVKGE